MNGKESTICLYILYYNKCAVLLSLKIICFATWLTESIRANMGGERIRDIQKNDDTKELGAPAAGTKYDRTKIRSHTCLPCIRDGWLPRRRTGHGRFDTVCSIKNVLIY